MDPTPVRHLALQAQKKETWSIGFDAHGWYISHQRGTCKMTEQ